MHIIFTLSAMATGLLLLQLEFLAIDAIDNVAVNNSMLVDGVLQMVTIALLIIIGASQIKAHLQLWKFLNTNEPLPNHIRGKNEFKVAMGGVRWMLNEQVKALYYVVNFGKFQARNRQS